MTVPMIKSIGDVPYPIDTHSDAFSPLLTAGAALGITGEATDSAAWLQRVSASDGPTTIHSIHGRTLRWNQLANLPWRVSGQTSGMTFTANSDGSVSVSGTASAIYTSRIQSGSDYAMSVSGHTYLVKLAGLNDTVNLFVFNDNGGGVNTQGRGTCIATASHSNTFYLRIPSGATVNETFHLCIYDLTAMFGAGSEPATVAEFEALYHESYYPYDAGSLLPVNMTGIESTAADESWTQTRSIPAGTLRGAGSVFDELTETERITRVGELDLSTVTWARNAARGDNIAYFSISNTVADVTKRWEYTISGFDVYDDIETLKDNPLHFFSSATSEVVNVNFSFPSALSSAADALAYVTQHGTKMHYALATPTTVEIDPPLNLTYRTAAGGTERVMVPTGENSAPPTIVTAQGYTAESLRDAALSAIAPVENGTASTNYGVGSYLVHGGQLCKVTTAIATGEAITIGTNVTATTVMAEILSLVQ